MGQAQVPAVQQAYGPFRDLAMEVHELKNNGQSGTALARADEVEQQLVALGDQRSINLVYQSRICALIDLDRPQEALAAGDELLRRVAGSPYEAKALANVSEVHVALGRLDEGLHCLARAVTLLDGAPRSSERYYRAISSVASAARTLELYDLADECSRFLSEHAFNLESHEVSDGQRAEVLVEWALWLEHVGLVEEAHARYRQTLEVLDAWTDANRPKELPVEVPINRAMRAVCLAKVGATDQAIELATSLVMPMRLTGQHYEAGYAHLAYGVALRARGDLSGARREFIAAAELCTGPSQQTRKLLFQYELALLAADELSGEVAGTVIGALQSHAKYLWRLRAERKAMMQQARRRVQLEIERATADRAATIDPLTGIGNRRCFDQKVTELVRDDLAGRVSLLLIDIDKFKSINDGHSHAVGDQVIREVAAVLKAQCRVEDTPVRFGGDEFAVFFQADVSTAAQIAERIRQVVKARDWDDVVPGLQITLSLGVAELAPGMTSSDLYDAADARLYHAKRQGRDQVAA